ncbi:acetyl-CoA carboxylase biotin carboxylase subunit family protein [Streptomyces sp. NPDC058374]|uniref:ATP-grasp domain-containing protein n=1 Tax=Streptomyces sp. NPDC058374 TaxID=3346466 RepID=UPI003664F129
MHILVLHRMPADRIRYHDGIDHNAHQVTYVGTKDRLVTLPESLPCRRVERPGTGDVAEEVISAVSGLSRPDMVIAMAESDLLPAARVREKLGVPGAREADVLPVRDKVVMKSAIVAAGLRAPHFVPLPEALARGANSLPWEGRTVLKPKSEAMSNNIEVLSTPSAVLDRVRTSGVPGGGSPDSFEIEEFIDSPIIHVDGIVAGGEILVIQAYRYEGTCLDFAGGDPRGNIQIATTPDIHRWTAECLSALNLQTSIFHLEGFQTADGLVFLEIGARQAGGSTVETFELATGVHLPSSYLRLLVSEGRDVPLVQLPADDGLYGDFVFPSPSGGAGPVRIRGEKEFRESPLVHRWLQLPQGASAARQLSYFVDDALLGGIIGPAHPDVLQRFVRDLLQHVTIG